MENKTDMDILNEFLIKIANAEGVGIRRKIVAIKNFISHLQYSSEHISEMLKIVCICGSTRFADLHAIKRWELEKTGKYICLMINYLPQWYAEKEFGEGKNDHFGEATGLKDELDQLHFRKIDMSDEIFVINKDGYIGESTRNEIEYAKKQGKKINYLEEIKE